MLEPDPLVTAAGTPTVHRTHQRHMGGANYLPTPTMTRPEPITVCVEPSCPTLVKNGIRCEKHRIPDRRGSRGYSTTAWQAARAKQLARHPDCEACLLEGTIVPASQVDHTDGLGPRGPRGTDPTNLTSLCASHHSRRTARDHKPGSREARGVA